MELREELRKRSEVKEPEEPRPVFFDLKSKKDHDRLKEVLEKDSHLTVIDTYEQQLKEYFVLQNPWLNMNHEQRDNEFSTFRDSHYGEAGEWQVGKWVYFPWRNSLLHLLDDEQYQQVRTGRNRNLISAKEQEKFYHSTIGIAGLSVGNSVALALVLSGGAKHIKLADPDTLELTNLNRIRGSITELTALKVHMAARQIYELDPYADITIFKDGLTEENIEEFFTGLDVVVDEIDSIGMKVRIRQEAQKNKIPVVMAADNGDGGILDVERHDLEGDIKPFHGRAGDDIAERTIGKKLPLPIIGKIITEELLGEENITERVQKSLLAIGSELPTWPQLGGAAILNGVAVAMTVRRILNEQPVVDSRALLSLESWIIPDYDSSEAKKKRAEATEEFIEKFNKLLSQAPTE